MEEHRNYLDNADEEIDLLDETLENSVNYEEDIISSDDGSL